MLRRVALAAGLIALVSFVATSAQAKQSSAVPGEAACRKFEVRQHNEAVFGHFTTRAEAKKLAAHAKAQGFQGIKIEDDGCGDFEVEIDGADTQKDRTSFADEAAKGGFQVTFEQTAWPMEFKQGQVVGVFASKRSLGDANTLMGRLATAGWRYIDLARVGTRWLVVMPQVPVKHALPIAHDVATAGFHIAFRSGTKP